jgi:deoxyribodipyrimidine photo-lyase
LQTVNIFWFRRDLRFFDNAALYHALKQPEPVLPIFIFDKNILDELEDKADRRVNFIYRSVLKLNESLIEKGSSLNVYYGYPSEIFNKITKKYSVNKVFANHDYEPYGDARDRKSGNLLKTKGASFHTFKDHVIFEKDEVLKADGKPYTVFSPYSRAWLSRLNDFYLSSYPVEKYFSNFFKQSASAMPSLQEIGFVPVSSDFPNLEVEESLIRDYDKTRNYPGEQGTSRIGVHLRFGTVSIRQLARMAKEANASYLNELIWREFYQAILWHFPQVGKHQSFKPEYDKIQWRNNEEEFARWCRGETGYPIVDAGMRELNSTGFMHNRVRMIVASFLVKHLLIDWRWGEAYFAEKLLDFELASNNGGWQWAAGSGCDAAPYFRIFNPSLQTKKFDPQLKYVQKWVPEFQEFTYPKPMVEHDFARKRALEAFGGVSGEW